MNGPVADWRRALIRHRTLLLAELPKGVTLGLFDAQGRAFFDLRGSSRSLPLLSQLPSGTPMHALAGADQSAADYWLAAVSGCRDNPVAAAWFARWCAHLDGVVAERRQHRRAVRRYQQVEHFALQLDELEPASAPVIRPHLSVEHLLQTGASRLGASAACLYWHPQSRLVLPTLVAGNDMARLSLRRAVRRILWPWLLQQGPVALQRPCLVNEHSDPGLPAGTVLFPLLDTRRRLAGFLGLCGMQGQGLPSPGLWQPSASVLADRLRVRLLADLDTLTGLPVRRAFVTQIRHWSNISPSTLVHARLITVQMVDWLHLQQVHGRAVTDQLLLEILVLLEARMRSRDLAARVADDTLCVLLKQCSASDAEQVLHQFEHCLQGFARPVGSVVLRPAVAMQIGPVTAVLGPDWPAPEPVGQPAGPRLDLAGQRRSGSVFTLPAVTPDNLFAFPGVVVPGRAGGVPVAPAPDSDAHAANARVEALSGKGVICHRDTSSGHEDLPSGLRARPVLGIGAQRRLMGFELRHAGVVDDVMATRAPVPADRPLEDRLLSVLEDLMPQARPARALHLVRETLPVLVPVPASLLSQALIDWLAGQCQDRHLSPELLCLHLRERDLQSGLDQCIPGLRGAAREHLQVMLEADVDQSLCWALLRQGRIGYLSLSGSWLAQPRSSVEQAMVAAHASVAHSLGAKVMSRGVHSHADWQRCEQTGIDLAVGRECGGWSALHKLMDPAERSRG